MAAAADAVAVNHPVIALPCFLLQRGIEVAGQQGKLAVYYRLIRFRIGAVKMYGKFFPVKMYFFFYRPFFGVYRLNHWAWLKKGLSAGEYSIQAGNHHRLIFLRFFRLRRC